MKNWDLIAYPFLNETERIVDHEVLTDALSAKLGAIYALETPLKQETWWLMDAILHVNGSIRGKLAISEIEVAKGVALLNELKVKNGERFNRFVYPTGHPIATEYHLARCMAKQVARNLYLLQQDGHDVPQVIIDFVNLSANLLFAFSVEVNRHFGVEEIEFTSKSY